jgi:hypothetical protein
MRYWIEAKTETGYGPRGLILVDSCDGRTLSISNVEDGKIKFLEECDGHFHATMRADYAIEALQEAIEWIKQQKEITDE